MAKKFKNIQDEILRIESAKMLYRDAIKANGKSVKDSSTLEEFPSLFIESYYPDIALKFLGSAAPTGVLPANGTLYKNDYGYGALRYLTCDNKETSGWTTQAVHTNIPISFTSKIRVGYKRTFGMVLTCYPNSSIGDNVDGIWWSKTSSTNDGSSTWTRIDSAQSGLGIVGVAFDSPLGDAGLKLTSGFITHARDVSTNYGTDYIDRQGDGILDASTSVYVGCSSSDVVMPKACSLGTECLGILPAGEQPFDKTEHIYTFYNTATLNTGGKLYLYKDDELVLQRNTKRRIYPNSSADYSEYTITNWPTLSINCLNIFSISRDDTAKTFTFTNAPVGEYDEDKGWTYKASARSLGEWTGQEISFVEVYNHYNDTEPAYRLVPRIHFNWAERSFVACWYDEINGIYYYRDNSDFRLYDNPNIYKFTDSFRNRQYFEIDEEATALLQQPQEPVEE